MMLTKKITGIRKAVGNAQEWVKLDNRHVAEIMMDLSDGSVWADCLTSCNSWKDYHNNHDIVNVSIALRSYGVDAEDFIINQKNVKKTIQRILDLQ